MKLAIVGATGAVGHEFLGVLEKSSLKFDELLLYASPRSAGTQLEFRGQKITVQVTPEGAIPADVILASAGASISKALAPTWVAGGSVVIDNSSAYRYDSEIPLVCPEVNGEAALEHKGIIANPNCTTLIEVLALAPLHKAFGIKRALISTYQSTSGAGAKGMQELEAETHKVLHGQAAGHEVFAHPIAFNLIPHIDVFLENGYTKEEMKVVWETRKIMGEPDLKISCTAVRVPIMRAHSEAIVLELERPATPEAARAILEGAAGVEVRDNPDQKLYPMPLTASGKWDVEVGRIRSSLVFEGGLEFFVSGDQLLKGAALNAVQIAEYLQAHGRLG